MTPDFTDPLCTLYLGDCVEVMAELPADSVDAIVTDPPYGLEFMGKGWDRLGAGTELVAEDMDDSHPFRNGTRRVRFGASAATMQSWHEAWARQAFRVAKPGAHLLAFGGTRTYHRLASAIEDAGWEIRDCLVYAYASGFPKSLNVAKQPGVCHCGALPPTEHEVRPLRDADVPQAGDDADRPGSVLFPSLPLEGGAPDTDTTGRLPNGAQPSVEGRGDVLQDARQLRRGQVRQGAGVGATDGAQGRLHHGAPPTGGGSRGPDPESNGSGEPHRPSASEQRPDEPGAVADERGPQARGVWPLCDRCGLPQVDGWGTALKPAWEPIVMARKPLRGTVAANVLAHGTGALNIDATRIPSNGETPAADRRATAARTGNTPTGDKLMGEGRFMPRRDAELYVQERPSEQIGRWPANLLLTDPIFDGDTPGVVGGGSAEGNWATSGDPKDGQIFGWGERGPEPRGYGDSGTYSRFFLIPKSSRSDREPVLRGQLAERDQDAKYGSIQEWSSNPKRENAHPTVKPVDLMRHLVRLVTPPGGTVLDCFAGSGSTLIAAEMEGFAWIGIEKEAEYVAIAEARLNGVQKGMAL